MKCSASRATTRPYTLADSAILAVALACFAAMVWHEHRAAPVEFTVRESLWFSGFLWALRLCAVVHYWVPRVLAWLTFAWLAIRLRPPRPPLRVVARQPGWAACASSAPLIVLALVAGGVQSTTTRSMVVWLPGLWYDPFTLAVGAAVIGAWLQSLWAGRWRAEAHWIDRLGRAVGAGWILEFAGVAFVDVSTTCWPSLLWH